MRTLAALTTLTTLALAGAAGAQAPALTGTTWTLTLMQADGRTFTPAPGLPARALRLDGRAVSGTTGCNTLRGPYAARGDVLRFGRLATTRRGCPGAGAEQETRFLNVLGEVTGYGISGSTLTLFAGSRDRLVFRAGSSAAVTPPETTVNLSGTWLLSGGTALTPVAGSLPTLTVTGDRVSGSAGCNRLTGSVGVQGTRVTFGPLATTRMACAPAVNAQEAAFLRFLSGEGLRASVQGQTLTLTGADGRTLVFRRAGTSQGGGSATPVTPQSATYTLATVGGQPAPATLRPVTLELRDGRVGGSDGCNSFGGSYRLEGTTLVLTTPLVTTLMACADTPTVALPALLSARPTVTVTASGLTLRSAGVTLTFIRD